MTRTVTSQDTMTDYIPTRDSVIERMVAALSEGRELASVTPAQALNVSQARIDAALGTTEVRPPTLGNNYTRHRTNVLRQKISHDRPITIVGLGGRELVKDRLKPFIEELGIEALLEICAQPGHEDLLSRVTPGITSVHFANEFSSTTVRYGGMNFAIARQRVVDVISAAEHWEVFNCPWDDRYPAFAVKTGEGSGAHATVLIFLNLFGTAEGQWVRSATGLDTRIEAFKEIMRAAMPLLTNSFKYAQPDPAVEAIRETHDVFLTMRAFGTQALGRVQQDLDRAKREFEDEQEKIARLQRELIEATTKQREAGEKVNLLSSGSGERIAAALESALRHLDQIKGMAAVRDVTFTTRQGKSALYVELYDCVVKDEPEGRTDRPKRLCRNLNFWLILDPDVTYPFIWDNAKKPSGQPSLHPNVYDGGDTCWGNISGNITEQLRLRDWRSVVTLTTRMLMNVGYPPVMSADRFPEAPSNLPTGFQYPRN